MNYGFYDPPCNGKSGKFLEEERTFVDYPLSGSPPVLEVSAQSKHSSGASLSARTSGLHAIIFYKLTLFSENCSLYRPM